MENGRLRSAIFLKYNLRLFLFEYDDQMKKSLVRRAFVVAALGLMLTACGGGTSSGNAATDTSGSAGVVALKTVDTVVGSGTMAGAGNNVSVHYTGWLYDVKAANLHGAQFDSSVGRTPFSFTLGVGRVIKGWDQGVVGMRVGGKRTLIIPASLAYGAQGSGPIPPNAALVFDVELLSVQ